MKSLVYRITGAALVAICVWWTADVFYDVSRVSPVHWALMLPHIALSAIPVFSGALAGSALLLKGRTSRTALVVFALTLMQAMAVSLSSPELRERYVDVVDRSVDTTTWTPSLP